MKLKVLYVLHEDTMFGASKSMIDLILTLKKEWDIEPIVLTFENTTINTMLQENDIKVISTGHRRNVFTKKGAFKDFLLYLPKYIRYKYSVQKALKIIKKEQLIDDIDLIHTNTSIIDFGAILSKKKQLPHIWHIREFADLDFDFVFMNLNQIKFMNNHADKFIFISKCLKEHWESKNIDSQKATVIYNGISTQEIKQKINDDEKQLKIVMVGGISQNKGQIILIDALSKISDDEKKNVIVDIYGRGDSSYVAFLKEKVAEYKLQSIVQFRGYSNSVEELLSKYDIGIVASSAEAFGRTTIEYMVAGLAVVASNSGANIELIEEGETGLFFNNSSHLAKIIVQLEKNRDLLKYIAINGQKNALKKYTKEINAQKIVAVYKELLESRGKHEN